ncbi:alpha/beta fold hydrolase [Primorskyibacter sp. 2E233]|uniref:alpha/beta fold hydrolase n=1 Tax=Primorskyibacter sp. 2E233 TaxID=3413431 RepID=UPI003BEF802C
MEGMFVEAASVNIRSFGHGAQHALALHCGLGSSGMWKAMASGLGERLTITAPDFPGHGRSARFSDEGDVHDQACDAVRGLLSPDMHLIGHSFGATVALRLALEAPEKVASLTLIEPVFFAAAKGRPGYDDHRAREEDFFAVCHSGNMAEAARTFNRIWGGGIPWDRFPKSVQEDMARGMPFVAGTEPSLWQDRSGMLAAGRIERLTCPVVLIRGAETVPIIAQVHEGLLDRLPNSREVVIEGAGHMLTVTHAADVAGVISEVV